MVNIKDSKETHFIFSALLFYIYKVIALLKIRIQRVLQRGCDSTYLRNQKVCKLVFNEKMVNVLMLPCF